MYYSVIPTPNSKIPFMPYTGKIASDGRVGGIVKMITNPDNGATGYAWVEDAEANREV